MILKLKLINQAKKSKINLFSNLLKNKLKKKKKKKKILLHKNKKVAKIQNSLKLKTCLKKVYLII